MFFFERLVGLVNWHTSDKHNFDATTGNGQTKVTPRTKSNPRASRPTLLVLITIILLYIEVGSGDISMAR